MENYAINVDHVINTVNGQSLRMINVKITNLQGKFPVRALEEFVSVTNGSVRVDCFRAFISGSQKEINASFTTDAFNVFSGSVDIEFGYVGDVVGVIEDYDIHANIAPLNPIFASATVPNADNAWLQNIMNAQ